MPSLLDLITNGRVPRSPFTLAAAPKEEPETLRKSVFVPDEEDNKPSAASSRQQLSVADVNHLTMGFQYGKPFHRLEVVALMDAFEADRDMTHLRRAVAILEHQLALESWKQ